MKEYIDQIKEVKDYMVEFYDKLFKLILEKSRYERADMALKFD